MEYTFISGATGGIGKAFAYSVAKRGGNLFLTGRSKNKLVALKEWITAKHPVKIIYFECDLTCEAERIKMIEFIRENDITFKRIINVAGVDTQKAFMQYTAEKLMFQLRVNVEATVHLTYELLKFKADKTEVITISSMSGQSPMPYFAVYSATKALLTNLFTSLHYELKGEGVKVTVVLPGGVPTRPDIIEDIKGQGLWGKLSAKSADFVAEGSLKAVKKNKIKYIPGAFNKLLNFLMRFAPKKIVLKFIARRWKKISKDAF